MNREEKKGSKSVSIMQPYFFPYIGYFQLIAAADEFIFRDDVQFIERGWIHRNRLLVEGKAKYLTIPKRSGSKYLKINEVEHVMDRTQKLSREYLLNLVSSYYNKAPFFEEVYPLIENVLTLNSQKIADLAIASVKETCRYIGLFSPEKRASGISYDRNLGLTESLIDICKTENADIYINAPGGKKLYSKEEFHQHNVTLKFVEPGEITYQQFENSFIPWLSIIDVMMFNSREQIWKLLQNYRLQ